MQPGATTPRFSWRAVASAAGDVVSALVRRAIAQAFAHALPAQRASQPAHHHSIGELFTAELSDEELDDDDEPCRTAPPSGFGRALRNDSRLGPCVAAWHDAIPDGCHRAALQEDAAKLVGTAHHAADAPRR